MGGSADGKWIEVDTSGDELRLPSLSGNPALHDPVSRAMDDDPIPDESVVVEVYRKIVVEHDGETSIAYALNGLSEEAVTIQLAKYYGTPGAELFGEEEE